MDKGFHGNLSGINAEEIGFMHKCEAFGVSIVGYVVGNAKVGKAFGLP